MCVEACLAGAVGMIALVCVSVSYGVAGADSCVRGGAA